MDLNSSGLVTIAFLKAQIDSGSDHLGIFYPLVIDAIPKCHGETFSTDEIQELIAREHGLATPLHTLTSLLKRAIAKGFLRRESGRYFKLDKALSIVSNVAAEKAALNASHLALGQELMTYAAGRDVQIESPQAALDFLVEFLNIEQVGILLNTALLRAGIGKSGNVKYAVVAEFISEVVPNSPTLSTTVKRMLEGLVLYQAAFQPGINPESKTFKDLTVVLDSNLVRQAIGYEGVAAQVLMRETIDVLRAAGADCIVFDKSIGEIRRLLSIYQEKLKTNVGRLNLRQSAMTRHLLRNRVSVSDLMEMSAFVERDVAAIGVKVTRLPTRVSELNANEVALATRLASKDRDASSDPRVQHDVDCVAGVLVLRKGYRSNSIESARAVFATSSPMVIVNARAWWLEDEKEQCVEPIVHIRAVANIAWLKRPKLSQDFKLHELVALCGAAMRPGQKTWDRFIQHLKKQQETQAITSDEAAAILVSSMTDHLLREAELTQADADEIDAISMDDVIERVKASYSLDSEAKFTELAESHAHEISAISSSLETEKKRAESAEKSLSEKAREASMTVDRICNGIGACASITIRFLVLVVGLCGGWALVREHPIEEGFIGVFFAVVVIGFVCLEVFGVLRHGKELSELVHKRVSSAVRSALERRNPWERR